MAKVIIETVRNRLEELGYELLESEYVNAKTKMRYLCRKHNIEHFGTWSDIKQGKTSCPFCKKEKISSKKLLSYEYIKNKIEEKGYKLLSNEYSGNKKKLSIECSVHGEFNMSFDSINNGQGCPQCGREKQRNSQLVSYEEVSKAFDKRGYVLLNNDYVNCETPIKYICPKHPNKENKISYNNLRRGSGCRLCYEESITGENSYLWQGGLTKENITIRNQKEYRLWRRSVFERDGYICKRCAVRGGNLQAHHILNFSDYPELRFDIDNGITLCFECHSPTVKGSFHSIYGTRNNTKEQLTEFLSN